MGEKNKLTENYKAIIQTYLEKKDEELRDKAIRIYYELQDCKEVRNKKMHRWARYMLERYFSLTEDDIKEIWLGSLEKKHISKQLKNQETSTTDLRELRSQSVQAIVEDIKELKRKLKWYQKMLKALRIKKYD